MGKFQDMRQQGLEQFKSRNPAISRTFAAMMKMGVPMFVSACGMYIQLVLEHYATYLYVQEYFLTDEDGDKKAFTMYDPVSDAIPFSLPEAVMKNATSAMDKLAFFPAGVFFIVTVYELYWSYRKSDRELLQKLYRQAVFGIWTKVCFIWAMLATLKGIFDASTIQPDSSGWQICKTRLSEFGVDYMRQPHAFFPDMFTLDFELLLGKYPGHTPPLRLCSDMMYSGHTFTVVVFCLGINELAYMALDERSAAQRSSKPKDAPRAPPRKCTTKFIITALIWLYVLCHQGLEIYIVLKTHFHYTSDVVAAIVFSLLMWTNAIIPYGAKLWATRRFRGFVPMLFKFNDGADSKREPLLQDDAPRIWSEADKIFIPAGEILVPGGQQHVYTDRQFTTLLHKQKNLIARNLLSGSAYGVLKEGQLDNIGSTENDVVRYCQQNMSMNDGVFIRDYCLADAEEDFLKDHFQEEDNTKYVDRISDHMKLIYKDRRVKLMWLVQAGIPFFLGVVVFAFTSFSWTLATYRYVHHYMSEDKPKFHFRLHDPFVKWLDPSDPHRHTNNDNFLLFYFLVCCFLFVFLILVSKKSTRPCALQVFHKANISILLCAIITSTLVLVTAVPDSVGRERCQYVLENDKYGGIDSLTFMKANHSLYELFEQKGRSRVHCGIAYGGWFQFVIILFLSYFELALLFLRKGFWKDLEKRKCGKYRGLRFVKCFFLALVGSVFGFILYVEWERFHDSHVHYTMDLVMHLSLAFLLYTNSLVTIAAKWWSQRCLQEGDPIETRLKEQLNSDGDILIPPCCVPFCCLWGRYHLYSDQKVATLRSVLFSEGDMSDAMRAAAGDFKSQVTPDMAP